MEVDFTVVGVMEVDVVEIDVVEVVDEDYLTNNLVRFGTYRWLISIVNLEGQSLDFLDIFFIDDSRVLSPFNSAHSCGKAL